MNEDKIILGLYILEVINSVVFGVIIYYLLKISNNLEEKKLT